MRCTKDLSHPCGKQQCAAVDDLMLNICICTDHSQAEWQHALSQYVLSCDARS